MTKPTKAYGQGLNVTFHPAKTGGDAFLSDHGYLHSDAGD
jgi:hypothetical protein